MDIDKAPDTRANNEKRNFFVQKIIDLMMPHHANEKAIEAYKNRVGELSKQANRENIGVEREVDILHWVLDQVLTREEQDQYIQQAHAEIPYLPWLQVQLAKKLEEDIAAEEARKKKEAAKKVTEAPGQMKIETSNFAP